MAIEFRRDGPWEVPDSWVWARLGDLGRWCSGGTPKADVAEYYGGDVPWFRITDLNEGHLTRPGRTLSREGLENSSAKIVAAPFLMFAMYGASIGKMGISDIDAATNQAIACCKPFDGINLEYLFWAIKRSKRLLISKGQGGAQPNISQTILLDHIIPVAPTAEQRRIVARIDELFTEIADGEAALARARDDLDTWRRALLKAAVTGKITREWRDYNRPNGMGASVLANAAQLKFQLATRSNRARRTLDDDDSDFDDLPEIPAGWAWAKLSDFAHASSYGTSVKCSQDASGVPVLRIPNIRSGRVDLGDLKRATKSLDIPEQELLDVGDLLIVRTNGSEDLIGRAAMVTESLPGGFYFASYLIRFRIVPGATLRRWIALYLESPLVRAWIGKNIATSAGQYNISQTALMRMPIPIPPETEMAACLELFQEIESRPFDIAQETVEAARGPPSLRQSILKSAFEGHLVEQNALDDPADRLLARLNHGANKETPARSIKRRRRALAAE
jgi:type I restriction enzyme S subunit